MPLDTLPEETILHIIKYIPNYSSYFAPFTHDITRDLFHLALCSRQINRISKQVLYGTVAQKTSTSLKKYLHQVLKEPELRPFARTFLGYQMNEYYSTPLRVEQDDLEMYSTAIERVGLSKVESQKFFDDVMDGHWNAIAALLFTLLPNLKYIQVRFYIGEPWINTVFHSAASTFGQTPKNYLQRLTKVSVHQLSMVSPLTVTDRSCDILQILNLKTVEVAEFQSACGNRFVQNPTTPYSFTNIRSLSMTDSTLKAETVQYLLRSCPNLKTFCYSQSSVVLTPHLVPRKMREGLSHLKHTLEKLSLDKGKEGDNKAYGSLKEFQVLKTLVMDASLLMGHLRYSPDDLKYYAHDNDEKRMQLINILPASLETLEIWDCNCSLRVKDQLLKLLKEKERIVPLLKKITVDFGSGYPRHIEWMGYDKEDSKDLEKACQDANVILSPPYAQPQRF